MRYYLSLFQTNLRVTLSFKLSMCFTLLLVFIKQLLFFAAWNFFFIKYHSIQGWEFAEVLLMWGIVSFGIGFTEIFFDGLRELPRIIENHQIDAYLLQPKNPILSIAMSKSSITSLGDLLLGLFLIGYSNYLFSPFIFPILILATIFIFSLYLYLSSLRFFLSNSTSLIRELYSNAMIIATQPSAAYQGFLKLFTITLLPTAFCTFYPIEFLRTHSPLHFAFTAIGTLLFFFGARTLFYFGLRRYESGSGIVQRS